MCDKRKINTQKLVELFNAVQKERKETEFICISVTDGVHLTTEGLIELAHPDKWIIQDRGERQEKYREEAYIMIDSVKFFAILTAEDWQEIQEKFYL